MRKFLAHDVRFSPRCCVNRKQQRVRVLYNHLVILCIFLGGGWNCPSALTTWILELREEEGTTQQNRVHFTYHISNSVNFRKWRNTDVYPPSIEHKISPTQNSPGLLLTEDDGADYVPLFLSKITLFNSISFPCFPGTFMCSLELITLGGIAADVRGSVCFVTSVYAEPHFIKMPALLFHSSPAASHLYRLHRCDKASW